MLKTYNSTIAITDLRENTKKTHTKMDINDSTTSGKMEDLNLSKT